jgi:ABC-2 type transport system permease protein
MPPGAHITAKLFATVVFSVIAFAFIYGLAILAGVRLTQVQWALLAAVHVGAVVPFSLIGLVIGYRFGQKAAIAVANVAFLGLAVLGGLWMPVTFLPQAIQAVAWVLPSWHLGEIALMVVGMADTANLWLHAGPLVLITIAAAVMAWASQDSNPA